MDDTIGDAPTAQMAKPTILVPPRGLLFSNGSGPGISPASSLFPEKGPFSFSMLLAGAMASPLASAQPQMEGPSPFFMVPPGLSPTGLLNPPGYLSSPLQSPFGMSHQQALAHVTAQAALSQSFKQMQAEFHHSSSNHPLEPETSKLVESISEISQPDHKKTVDKPAGDGYNWRKYGQKHVKASGYPRSYYKCTHVDCPVKKKVERNSDGGVSDVTYKGEHNHDLPKHNKRGKDNSDFDTANVSSHSESEISQTTAKPLLEHRPEISDTYDEKDDSVIIVEKGDDDEPIAKRRSLDIRPSVSTSSNQGVSESKIVLQTKSEVDILHDGYKWRKYGQKVVKGNSHPRSYYRCTYAGCNVRKHVERASTDPKAVITTYEGKHNHDIPTGKRNGHSGAYTSAEQLNTQKAVSKDDFGDTDKIPMTLQLKEGQIVA